MKKWLVLAVPAVTLGFAACSSSTTTEGDAGADATAPTGTTTATSTGSTAPSTPQDSAVPLPPPATFDLTSGTCTETTPCGGDPTGTWDYSAGCISDADLADFQATVRQACPTATVSGVAGTMSGRVTFGGNAVTRKGTVSAKTDLTIPQACASQVGGDCNLVGQAIVTAGGGQVKGATCATGGSGGCNCKVELAFSSDKIGTTYTTSGSKLTTSDGDEYDYCVKGQTLSHKQTRAGSRTSNEPGVYEATKR